MHFDWPMLSIHLKSLIFYSAFKKRWQNYTENNSFEIDVKKIKLRIFASKEVSKIIYS